ncbi:MFS transporter [Legionella impletisoli]|uniref:Lysosomal dipeptide transporter MFSD1 n=1 Tax=Legionella impletisoli TaxID=343510 RepID=A0A917N9W4_9GAMM|nr:MFS transporter [Legionella impletisoli]GGI80803.1 MFS transporter [Legionella impletisoli]
MAYSNPPQSAAAEVFSFKTFMPWIVWGLGCLFYFYECLLQVSPSVMSHELMRDFAVTSHTLGILSGVYFYSYAAMQLPGGLLLDYFGPRKLLTIATAICAVSTIAFGLTNSFYMACVARLMIGFGSAFAAIGAMKLAANWFPSERFALLTGIMVTIGMLGAIGGEAPLAILIDNYGWRDSMVIMGSIGIALAFLIFFIARDVPKDERRNYAAQPLQNSDEEPLLKSLFTLIKNKQLWLIATYGGLMYMATPVFCGLWGVPFLMFKMDLAKATAANYISLVFVGWAIASPLWGIYSGRIGRRKPPLYFGSIGACICSTLFIFAPIKSGAMMQSLLFLFGVFSAGFLPAFAVAKELCSQRYVATGLSFMNMMNMIGIAVAQPIIGYILDLFWSGKVANGVRVYPMEAYHLGLALLPVGMLISLLILPLIRETYCKNVEENE